MYKNETDPSCLLCKNGEENIEHFILNCETLSRVRDPIQQELIELLNAVGMETDNLSTSEKMQIILDITPIARDVCYTNFTWSVTK